MNRRLFTLFVLVSLSSLLLAVPQFSAATSLAGTTQTPQDPDAAAVEQAILDAVAAHREAALAFLVFQTRVDNLRLSADRAWAAAWLILANPQTGEVLPTEPGLALAQREGETWRVALPGDDGWTEAIKAAPPDLLSEEAKDTWLGLNARYEAAMPTAPLTGYLLPWAAGQTVYLSRSVAHDASFPTRTAHYSFDFYISGVMFDLYAAKSGTVWGYKDTVPNNDHNDVNYLVLEDTTTSPTSYQLYLHLAQGSIPSSLKIIGKQVVQGQFIGKADNTGQSTGHHLHFQVEGLPYWPSGSLYWARSVDFVFGDVNINGGRPRRHDATYDDFPYCLHGTYDGYYYDDVCDTGQPSYVSANIPKGDVSLPDGELTSPAMGATIQQQVLSLAGWGSDADTGLASAQFIAYYADAWHEVGPLFTASPLDYNWDLCSDNVPDGAVGVAMELTDNDGNVNPLAGLQLFTKNYACPVQPTCTPDADDVVVFEDAGPGGGCVSFGVGEYANAAALGSLGENDAAAIRVGSSVMATLFSGTGFSGRAETLLSDDASLADNLIGADTMSSLMVQLRTTLPLTPTGLLSGALREDTSVSLVWESGGGATGYQARYTSLPTDTVTSTLLAEPLWRLGSLAPMTYTWQVRGHNGAGYGAWSPVYTFTVPDESTPVAPVAAPVTFDMESSTGWLQPGTWGWKADGATTPARSGTHSWWYQGSGGNYDDDHLNFGDLTSPPITIPATGTYYLRFWYRYETETAGIHWDQRWLQISANGGAFTDLVQFYDDPMFDDTGDWLQSPAIDLSAYAGQTIRVRFDFTPRDAANNGFKGWGIDDLSITADPPPACSDGDDSPAQATLLAYGQTLAGEICPNGDVDYYRLTGAAGDHLAADIAAQAIGSPLDAYLVLLDSDGRSVLAENNDETPGSLVDPFVGYALPHDGTYDLKVRAFDHPNSGGLTHDYSLHLFQDTGDPSVVVTSPASGAYLPSGSINVTALATDTLTGISHVDFFWHDGGWLTGVWQNLGSDWDGSNGWSVSFNTSSLNDQKDIAFYVHAYDRAGNWLGAGVYNLGLDRTPPYTLMSPISPTQASTAFLVQWGSYDAVSGLDHYDLQWNANGGGWQDYAAGIDGGLAQWWVVGAPGGLYDLRMRGVDNVGNTEAYPTAAEITTYITPTVCTVFDAYENDNALISATLVITGAAQDHSFCNPISGTLGLYDEDWLALPVVSGTRYIVTASPLAGSAAAALTLFDSGGVTLTQAIPAGFGYQTRLSWLSDRIGLVYLRLRHLDGRVAGNGVTYRVMVVLGGQEVYLPVIRR